MKLEFSWQIIEKLSDIKLMKICPLGAELFHADGRTDITVLINAVRNLANRCTKKSSVKKFRRLVV
jgi:hypothetical protein